MRVSKDNEYWRIGDVGILWIYSQKSGKKKFLFDWEDYNKVKVFHWAYKSNKMGHDYAHAMIGSKQTGFTSTVTLHRLVTSFEWPIVDHRSRDTYDNRKSNLRQASASMNKANSHTRDSKGVRFVYGKYQPTLCVNGRDVVLAKTEDFEEAKLIFRKAHNNYYGEFSPYNENGEIRK